MSSSPPVTLNIGLTPELYEKAEAIFSGMPKFPGSKVDDYSKLVEFYGCDIIIISMPFKPIILQNLPINANGFAIILVADGSGLEQISNSELKEMGFGLSPALAAAVDAGWSYVDGLDLETQSLALETVPPLSLNWIGANGSIAVSSATGVNWIVVGGHDLLWSNFEYFKKLTPEISCQMSALDILHASSGVAWTLSDTIQLLNSFSEARNMPLPSTNGKDCSVSILTLGSDDFKENNSNYKRFLSSFLGKMQQILLTAGMNIDSQIGAAIIGVGVASPPVSQPNDNGNHITPFDCLRLVSYASSCLLIFTSWMLNHTSRGTPLKEKRLKALSHLSAGGAMICLFVGIFCNLFAPLPLPYAVCDIFICVFVLLGAAGYNAFSK